MDAAIGALELKLRRLLSRFAADGLPFGENVQPFTRRSLSRPQHAPNAVLASIVGDLGRH